MFFRLFLFLHETTLMKELKEWINAFCRIVLRHEAINAWRDLKRKEEREISLDYLMAEKYFETSATDSYFEKQDKPTVFLVFGKVMIVDNERLATALPRRPAFHWLSGQSFHRVKDTDSPCESTSISLCRSCKVLRIWYPVVLRQCPYISPISRCV